MREDMWSGYRERIYRGQRCLARSGGRTRLREGWRYFNFVNVEYLTEDGRTERLETVPAGRFNAGSTCTGRILRWNGQAWDAEGVTR